MRLLCLVLVACGNSSAGIDATVEPADVPDDDLTVWPNAVSFANSDPWLAEHHAELRVLQPRLLVLNYVNAETNAQMLAKLDPLVRAFREGSRYHAYADAAARPMLEFQIEKAVDLRDTTSPPNWPYRNSSLYPREEPVQGYWGFDYAALFTREFADRIGITDASGRAMDLCDLVAAGRVHEVWIYGDADVPDVSAAEILELKPRYDGARRRMPGTMDRCAGNGCFDEEDVAALPPHCTRTLRIGWVNRTRGPGCFLESENHGFESTARSGTVPYLADYFREFADFNLNTRYGTPFDSWYACATPNCISYTSQTSLAYNTGNAPAGTIADYRPACGNAHVPPNGRFQYDDQSPAVTLSTCEHFRLADGPNGTDLAEPFSSSKFRPYDAIAPDCAGGWHVYWMQSFPGVPARAKDKQGLPMLSWWPFLYY